MKSTLLAMLAGLALAACETAPTPPNPPDSAAPAPAAPRAADPHEENAPLRLSLEPVSDEAGVVSLTAHLDATTALVHPIELSVELPPGASLIEGSGRQSVPVAAGRTSRSFRIQRGASTAPVKVIAHFVHPTRAWGLHAEKLYPEPPAAVVSPVKAPAFARPPRAPSRVTTPRPEAP